MQQDRPRTAIEGRFADTVALVTGGSAGIGLATVIELCREGAAVAFVGNEAPDGEAVAAALTDDGYRVRFIHGDVSDESCCRSAVAETVEHFGRLDHLVNNAFSFTAAGTTATREEWQRSLFVGPVAYAVLVAAAAEAMAADGGAIVNVSSISAHIAQPNRWTYNTAKGAVDSLTRCMALDLAPRWIRVNSVSPGWIWTREVAKAAEMDGGGREKWEPVWGQFHLLERCGHPVEVAASILFLLSADASFVTGTDLAVDGGYRAIGPEGLGKTTMVAGSD